MRAYTPFTQSKVILKMADFIDVEDGYDRSESNDRSRAEKKSNDDFESTKAVPASFGRGGLRWDPSTP